VIGRLNNFDEARAGVTVMLPSLPLEGIMDASHEHDQNFDGPAGLCFSVSLL
jgi:hypothetical protein